MTRSPLHEYRALRKQMDALSQIVSAPDAGEAWEAIERLRTALGFGYTTFGPFVQDAGVYSLGVDRCSTAIHAVLHEYQDRGVDAHDPVLRALSAGADRIHHTGRIETKTAEEHTALDQTLDIFRRYDISNHMVMRLPLPATQEMGFFGVGILGDGGPSDFKSLFLHHEATLRLAASAYLVNHIEAETPSSTKRTLLPPAEASVLSALAEGLTLQEVAERDGKALSTVRHQIYSAKKRLGARTVTEAVLLAERLGSLQRR